MERKGTQLLFPLLFMWLFISCEQDDPAGNDSGYELNGGDICFEIGFVKEERELSGTRVTTDKGFNSAWDEGDEIGLFAVSRLVGEVKGLSASENYIHNVKLTYRNGGWVPSEELWFLKEKVLDFYAYYPYNDNSGNPKAIDPTNMEFMVKQDQSIKSNHQQSDLLTAKADNNGDGYSEDLTVQLQFSHALSLVQVSIPVGGKGYGPDETLTVKLQNIKPAVVLDLSTMSVGEQGENIQVTMCRMEDPEDLNYKESYTYRAVVPAQSLETDHRLFRFENKKGQEFMDGILGVSIDLKAGRAEKFTRTLPVSSLHTVLIPAGEFLMGSPDDEPNRYSGNETQHSVRLTQDFYMSKYPVTNRQYAYFLNSVGVGSDGRYAGGSYPGETLIWNSYIAPPLIGLIFNLGRWEPINGHEDHPVVLVSWYGADEYARWVGGSLPTEAQWEYACRGGQENMPFGIGDGTKLTGDMANFNGRYIYELPAGHTDLGNGVGYAGKTTAVGEYLPNGYGLYDMHGNVWEWCSDWYDKDYGSTNAGDPAIDPTGPTMGSIRVLRGGSWYYSARYCRAAYRYDYPPGSYGPDPEFGFRVVFVP